MTPAAETAWAAFEREADAAGLNVRLVLTRDRAERGFRARAAAPTEPARDARGSGARVAPTAGPEAFHGGYRRLVLLGSAGKEIWERFQTAAAAEETKPPDPLDRHTERIVESLAAAFRAADPGVLAVYPFDHPRRIVPWLALLEGSSQLRFTPFGVGIHSRFGPWFAWRAALLSELPLPLSPAEEESPCAACPAPCVAACPAGAVAKEAFDWRACVDYRVAEQPCRATCLARMACPVGTEYRYGKAQTAYHYSASLRMIEAAKRPK